MTTKYDNLSIRGRVAYLIMSFERYVLQTYPDKDMTIVAELMWNIVNDSDYIDESAYRYMEIIPMYIHEAPDYKTLDLDYLTEIEYNAFVALIPSAEDDPDLNTIMHRIYDVAMEYAYTTVKLNEPETKQYLQEVDEILAKNNIEPPDINLIPKYAWDDSHGWGDFIDSKPLSIILK